jgi:hypothetical protein
MLLHNEAAHKVSIRNIKVSKRERHITYSVTKHTYVCNDYVMCTLHFVMAYVCDAVHCVSFMFRKLYDLELLCCVQLRFVTLRHVTFTLCCFTLCSNIINYPKVIFR